MSPDEIADELTNFRANRAAAKRGKESMVRIAVTHCKVDRESARKMGDQIDIFIEGWLIGQGIRPHWDGR